MQALGSAKDGLQKLIENIDGASIESQWFGPYELKFIRGGEDQLLCEVRRGGEYQWKVSEDGRLPGLLKTPEEVLAAARAVRREGRRRP